MNTNDNGKTYTIIEGHSTKDMLLAFVAGLIAGAILALSLASYIRYAALCVR